MPKGTQKASHRAEDCHQLSWRSCLPLHVLWRLLTGEPLIYASPAAGFFRASVLEPEGTVEIKYRKKDLVKTIRRLDPISKKLVEQLGEWV